jgi:NarL family two-component system response regulator LiaR
MAENKIRVLIVDDHQVVRQGLRTFLELQDDLDVVGEAADGSRAVELAHELKPDVILMDLVMPRMDGIAATRQITSDALPVKIIALTSFTGDENIFPALEAGAFSYLLKDVSPEGLVDAVRAAFRGEARLHPDVAKKIIEKVSHPTSQAEHGEELTDRELEVVALVAQGASNHDIAIKLAISEKTVKTHISNILSKLQLADRTQLAIYALKKGLVEKE